MLSISFVQTFAVFVRLTQLIQICESSLELILTPDGLPMCALDSPSYSMLACDILGLPDGVPDVLRCGYQCSVIGNNLCAAGFNYVDSGQCQFYASPPVNCSTRNHSCKYYEIQRTSGLTAASSCWPLRDINECLTNNGGCDPNAQCTNNVGSFSCTCNPGFVGNGFKCSMTSIACEASTLNITCPGNSRIVIQRANYGRLSSSICCGTGIRCTNTNCIATTSLVIVTLTCNAKSSCSVEASINVFINDPCPYIGKYLEVTYSCA